MENTAHRPANPFLVYGYVSPEYFCDREKETANIIAALDNGRNLTLIAPRRIGKTGLIKNVFHHIKENDSSAVCVYVDIFSTRSQSDFIQTLGRGIFEELKAEGANMMERITSFLGHLRPVISMDSMTGSPSVSFDIAHEDEEQTLKGIFDRLESSGKRCYVAIDEFQQIAKYPETGTEALLRSYIQFIPNVHFIFAGSSQHLMTEMFISANRPFYNSTQIVQLSVIDRDKYYDFASRFFAAKNGAIARDVFDYIYDTFDGHTWYVQTILNRLYAMYDEVETVAQANRSVKDVIDENTVTYETLTAMLPDKQLSLLKAIAKEGAVHTPNNGSFITKYKLKAASSVSSALKALLAKELVYKSPKGFIVYDRLMDLWLKES